MDLNQLLGSKKRTVRDLVQFVNTRTDRVPNYALLIGAGASITSGIRSGSQLVESWRKEIFTNLYPSDPYNGDDAKIRLAKEHSQWYSMTREYSSLFEKKFDLPRQRRMFVESEVSGKFPSIGYAYLIRLIENNFFNAVFTTNFDDLLNEAFHQFSDQRPIVCAHDSSIASVTVTSKRPKIIKIHGDYLFDDIKSTVKETESLEENTKKKFIEFGKDHGLIVVGYGGHDRSVMDVLNYLLKQEEYLKHGIYWCLREGETYSEELIKLLWKDRVYWVPIEGFDELVASMHRDCVGDALPISTALVSEKPRHIISKFCSSEQLGKSRSAVITQDLSRLKLELERDALFDAMRPFTDVDEERPPQNRVSDSDRIRLMSIRKHILERDVASAQALLERELAEDPSEDFRSLLLGEKLDLEMLRGDSAAAIQTVEQMIAEDPTNAGLYIQRARLELATEKQKASIEKALSIDPYFSTAYRRKAILLEHELSSVAPALIVSKCADIISAHESSLAVYPTLGNPTWGLYLEFLISGWVDSGKAAPHISALLERANKIDEFSSIALDLQIREAVYSKRSSEEKDAILAKIKKSIECHPKSDSQFFELLHLKALHKFERTSDLVAEAKRCDQQEKWSDDWNYRQFRASVFANVEGKISSAIRVLSGAERKRGESRCVVQLVELLCLAGRIDEAKRVLAGSRFASYEDRQRMLRDIYSAEGLHDKAAQKHAEMFSSGKSSCVGDWIHELLLGERFAEAEEVGRSFLKKNSFNIHFDIVIANLELSMLRQHKHIDKPRLQRVLQRTDLAQEIRGGICYLLEDKTKAASNLVEAIQKDRSTYHRVMKWALFKPQKDRAWLEATVGRFRVEEPLELEDQEPNVFAA